MSGNTPAPRADVQIGAAAMTLHGVRNRKLIQLLHPIAQILENRERDARLAEASGGTPDRAGA
jgi:hypothetical protein